MVALYPFAAIRPPASVAQSIAAVPYDVVNAEEVRNCIGQNPHTFLRVSRADAELPSLPPYDPRVYEQARIRFKSLFRQHLLEQDDRPCLYIYRVLSADRSFAGLVACVDVEDYLSGRVRKHELTQYEKEEDRTRHIEAINAQTGLVFLVYRNRERLSLAVESALESLPGPEFEVHRSNGTRHQVWRVRDPGMVQELQERFGSVDALYIADGHHRAAAAVRVARARQEQGRGTAESGRFMAVLFADDQVMIHGYSRLVTDLHHLTPQAFLEQVGKEFPLRPCDGPGDGPAGGTTGSVFLYLPGQWYELEMPPPVEGDPVGSLDVSILQHRILYSILGITDSRRDPRLHYLGGVYSREELETLVDGGEFAVAFHLRPVDIGMVMSIADAGGIMPPKSTWFEPKLLSGLLIHSLD